jgi:hypothetical protein
MYESLLALRSGFHAGLKASCEQLSANTETEDSEETKLKKENDKLKYRLLHLEKASGQSESKP